MPFFLEENNNGHILREKFKQYLLITLHKNIDSFNPSVENCFNHIRDRQLQEVGMAT
ncbi:MAG: hypothetical protein AAGJ08_15155 [Cyanobacteria bacterium P01_H01_bin.35]